MSPIEDDDDENLSGLRALGFVSILTDSRSLTTEEVLAYLEAVRKYRPQLSRDQCFNYHYILTYFSGYGGCDSNGRVYILLDAGKPDDKIYIDWIVSILKNRYSKHHSCILLFELYRHQSSSNASPRLPYDNNFVVAISGLNETPPSGDVSEWTDKLCDALMKCNIPLTDILDKLPGQYVSGAAGTLFLNGIIIIHFEFTSFYIFLIEKLANEKAQLVKQPSGQTSGVMLMVTVPSLRGVSKDKSKILNTFRDHLNFKIIKDHDSSPVDYDNVLALIKAVAYYQDYGDSYKFFAFYYSGYGGSDNGRPYIQLSEPGSPNPQRIYLDWIVSLFSQKVKSPLPCLMFFELCSESANDSLLLLPNGRKFLVAMSGLNTTDIGRLKEGGGGIWTHKLCDYIEKIDEPITVLLDKTQNELPELACQYVSSIGFMYLQKSKQVYAKFKLCNVVLVFSISTAAN